MKETGTFLQRAVLAGAVAIPLAAVGAVLLSDEDSDEHAPCDGCGNTFFLNDLTLGDAGSLWCYDCRPESAPGEEVRHFDDELQRIGAPAQPFDCVEEDDGEP